MKENRFFLRTLFCIVFLTMLLLLGGCWSNDGSGSIIKYDLAEGVKNLDPQFATDETARMIISNTFEGLLRQLPNGEVEPGVAERYTVSDDGLIYTFYLRQNARWSGEKPEPVTAHDFVFALRRLFNPVAPSPFASSYSCIAGSDEVLAGKDTSLLGVKTIDDYTLSITLRQRESTLPSLLASSSAMPCKETFFLSTRGRYGLELAALRFNGPFTVRGWDNQRSISLRANPNYEGAPVVAGGVELYIPSMIARTEDHFEADPTERFFSGTTDACRILYNRLGAVEDAKGSYVSFEDTVWVLALNTRKAPFSHVDARKAVAYSLERSIFKEALSANLRTTSTLVPPAVISAGKSFRAFAGDGSPMEYSQDLARRSRLKAEEELGVSPIPFREILICDDGEQALLAGYIQRSLQNNLALPLRLVRLPLEELMARVEAGNYEAAILPVSASYSSAGAILASFKSDAPDNLTGYQNWRFDALLASVSNLSAGEQNDVYRQAEQLLLAESPVIPLYFETTYYAMAAGVEDIGFSPFLSGMEFRDARKK